jgi:putative hydrolase of HD superfamily
MISERLRKQFEFISEIEKLKIVYRQNTVYDKSRHENSAEHSWHIALMAFLLCEHSALEGVSVSRVVEMLLVHDIVEIDAGDTFLFDGNGNLDKEYREQKASERIFGLLPKDQAQRFVELWKEFDERKTADALFASALDNLQPVLNHYLTDGCGIKNHNLTVDEVIAKKEFISSASPELWEITLETIRKSEKAGFYRVPDTEP